MKKITSKEAGSTLSSVIIIVLILVIAGMFYYTERNNRLEDERENSGLDIHIGGDDNGGDNR